MFSWRKINPYMQPKSPLFSLPQVVSYFLAMHSSQEPGSISLIGIALSLYSCSRLKNHSSSASPHRASSPSLHWLLMNLFQFECDIAALGAKVGRNAIQQELRCGVISAEQRGIIIPFIVWLFSCSCTPESCWTPLLVEV